MVAYVAGQLGVDPATLAAYPGRPQTRREQLSELMRRGGFRSFGRAKARALVAWLTPMAQTGRRPAQLAGMLIDELRRQRILPPTPRVLELVVHHARARAERVTVHKKEHEDRIKRVTGLGPAMQTTVLQLKVRIGTQVVEVSNAETAHALMPRYPAGDPKVIDLTALGDEKDDAFYRFAATRIRDEVGRLYATGGELETSKHLSVLALAPIPLLMVVGETLSNKVQTEFYQCHRDRSERWTWHEGKPVAKFMSRRLRAGTQLDRVALTLSLSGTVAPSMLPPGIDESFTVYEITLDGETPYPGCLKQREDLDAFRQLYRRFLADVKREHPEVSELHLFPAIPAPVAVSCGFDVLPKVHPTLVVYDHYRQHGGFIQRLKVNEHDRK